MRQIYDEALDAPETMHAAPLTLGLGRVDEVTAARHPILRWTPAK
jgi:glycine dehydrogenase subunit 2